MTYSNFGDAYAAAQDAFEQGNRDEAKAILLSAKEGGLKPAYEHFDEYKSAATEALKNGDKEGAMSILTEAKTRGLRPEEKSPVSQYETAEIVKDRKYKSLYEDELWIRASADLYKMHNKQDPSLESMKDIKGTTIEEKLAEYGFQQMAGFNFDLVEMSVDASRLKDAEDETKRGFIYMMDTYDNTDMSWKTTWDATKEVASDPTNYLGFGAGAVTGLAAKVAGKKAFKELIKSSVKRSAIVGAYEGALVSGADAHIRQNVRIDAGAQEEYNLGTTAIGAGVGMVAGAALASAGDVIGTKVGAKFRAKKEAELAKVDEAKIRANAEVASKIEAETPTVDVKKEADVLDPEYKAPSERATGAPKPRVKLKTHKVTENADGTVTKTIKTEGEVTRGVVPKVEDLYKLVTQSPNKVPAYVAQLHSKALIPEEILSLGSAINETSQKIGFNHSKLTAARIKATDPAIIERLDRQLEKAGESMLQAKALYEVTSSLGGKLLQDTQNYYIPRNKFGVVTKEAVDISSIKYYSDRLNDVETNFDKLIKEAGVKQDRTLIAELLTAKANERAPYVKALEPFEADGIIPALKMSERTVVSKGEKVKHLTHQAVELSIGGVFSAKTVLINMAWPATKASVYPLLRFANSPEKWNMAGAREAARGVSLMKASARAGFLAAADAFKYEQTFLTRDASRILEGGIKVKGRVGGVARAFPRLLAATDAFNQEMIAADYLMHQATEVLETQAKDLGLSGKAFFKHIDDNIEAEMAKGYQRDLDAAAIQPLMEKGSAKGFEGEELDNWVAEQATRMGSERMKRLVDEGALDEVQRALYKKEFDPSEGKQGTQYVLASARGIEQFHQRHPAVKLAGLLFTRTPLRVMEEAFRMTPALNLVLPSFRDDLAGNNGHYRQATARTELMLSNALLAYTMTKVASGQITGSEEYDWTKSANQESEQPALTITLDDGNVLDFSRIEPFKVPMLMVVNTLEGYEKANVNGNISEEETNKALQNLGIAMTAFALTLKDAGVLSGVTDTMSTLTKGLDKTNAGEADVGFDKVLDLLAKKSMAVIPSEISKQQKQRGKDELITTATRSQLLRSKFQPNHSTLARKHNIFGKVRTIPNPNSLANPFTVYKRDSRYDTEGQHKVGEFLAKLEVNGYGNFTSFPTESKYFDGDLREKYLMVDGRKTNVYNLIMAEVARSAKHLERGLLEIVNNKSGLGTPDNPSPRVAAINTMRGKVFENAIVVTMRKYPELQEESINFRKSEQTEKSLFPNI